MVKFRGMYCDHRPLKSGDGLTMPCGIEMKFAIYLFALNRYSTRCLRFSLFFPALLLLVKNISEYPVGDYSREHIDWLKLGKSTRWRSDANTNVIPCGVAYITDRLSRQYGHAALYDVSVCDSFVNRSRIDKRPIVSILCRYHIFFYVGRYTITITLQFLDFLPYSFLFSFVTIVYRINQVC